MENPATRNTPQGKSKRLKEENFNKPQIITNSEIKLKLGGEEKFKIIKINKIILINGIVLVPLLRNILRLELNK
jgi:hypothetical protein